MAINRKSNLPLFRVLFLMFFCLSLALVTVSAQRQPVVNADLNTWGGILIELFDVIQTKNGTLKAGINASIQILNVTGDLRGQTANFTTVNISELLVYGTINATTVNATQMYINGNAVNHSITCIGLTGSADLCDGTDNTGGDPDTTDYWRRINMTDFLGPNSSILRVLNMSNIRESLFDATNLTLNLSTSFNNTNITTLSVQNLNDLDGSNFFDLSGCGAGATSTAYSAIGTITCESILITESQISDLTPHIIFTYLNITQYNGVENVSMIKVDNTSWAITAVNDSINSYYNHSIDLSKYNQSILIGATVVGGEVSGTIDNIALDDDALNDQYVELEDAFNKENYSSEYSSTGFNLQNYSVEYSSTGFKIGNLTDFLPQLGTVNINSSGTLNISGNITFTQLLSCDTINTNAQGLLTCGTDATATADSSNFQLSNVSNSTPFSQVFDHPDFSNFQEANITRFLGVSNETMVRLNASNVGNLNISLNFSVDTSTFFVDEASNRVGIGTTSPDSNLHVVGGLNTEIVRFEAGNGRLVLEGVNPSSSLPIFSINWTNVDSGTTYTSAMITSFNTGDIDDGDLRFYTTQAGVIAEQMRIDEDGNVGIGTTTPTQKLEIIGNVKIIGNVTINDSTSDGSIFIDSENDAIFFTGENGSLYQPVYGSDDDLVLYLPFETINGSTQYDRSPYGNDGTLQGGINCNATQGKYGAGCFFNNNTNDYISISTDVSLDLVNNSDYTISVWINPRSIGDINDEFIIQQMDGSGTGRGILFIDFDDGSCAGANEFASFVGATNTCSGISATREWTYLALVVVENSSTDNVQFYINGKAEGSGTVDSETNDNANWRIGSNKVRVSLNGTIDEVMFYSRALTPEEIRTHYLRGSGYGAMGAITADKFRIVNTSGSRILELNGSVFEVFGNSGADTFVVDRVNGRVGIGTATPAHTLHVIGNINITGSFNATRIEANEILVNGVLVNRSILIGATVVGGEVTGTIDNIAITLAKDIVAGTGLTGGEDNVLPGADADTTLSVDFIVVQPQASAFKIVNLTDFLPQLGTVNINSSGTLNISGNITFTQLLSCDTINTDSTGLLTCGVDATATADSSNFQYTNITEFLGVQNESILTIFNLSSEGGVINHSVDLSGYTLVVTGSAPITSSGGQSPDIGLTLAKDIVAGTGLTGGEDNVLPGADADTTLSVDFTVVQDSAAAFKRVNITDFFGITSNFTGGDNISLIDGKISINSSFVTSVTGSAPITSSSGSTPDIGLTLAKDIVAGTGLTGGEDNVLPGADADTTLSVDFTVVQSEASAYKIVNLTDFLPQLGTVNINGSGTLNISGNITFTQLLSCDTINTNAAGLLTCGDDATGGGSPTDLDIVNQSMLDNGSIIRAINISSTNILEINQLTMVTALLPGNLSGVLNTTTGFEGDVTGAYDAITVKDDILVKANFADEDWGEATITTNSLTINTGVIDADNIGTNAVQLDELDVSDVSDDIAGDIAEGELADNIIVTADIKDGEVSADDLAPNSCQDSEIDYSVVTLADFTNDPIFVSNNTDIKVETINITNKPITLIVPINGTIIWGTPDFGINDTANSTCRIINAPTSTLTIC